MSSRRRITLQLALGLGIVLGVLLIPARRDARDLERLDDADPVARRIAWARVVDARRDDGADAALLARVRELSDAALADARQPLIDLGAWHPDIVGTATFRRLIDARLARDRVGDATSVVLDFITLAEVRPASIDRPLIERCHDRVRRLRVTADERPRFVDAIARAAWPDRLDLLDVTTWTDDVSIGGELNALRAVLEPAPASAVDRSALRAIADAPETPPRLRRLAQWRSGDRDPARRATLAALPRESVALDHVVRALLAEGDRDPAIIREAWVQSFDDSDRVAAALLTAFAGLDPTPCTDAASRTSEPELRALLQLAAGTDHAATRAARLHLWSSETKRYGIEAAIIAAARGDADALSILTMPPVLAGGRLGAADAPAARLVAIERLVPAWIDHLGPPAGAATEDVAEHLRRLDDLRRLTAGSLAYDRASRRYTVRGLPLPVPVERE